MMVRRLFSLVLLGVLLSVPRVGFTVDLGLGRQAALEDPAAWERWPSGLAAPSALATADRSTTGIVFTVPEYGREMTWKQSIRPAWLDFHRYLTIAYRATGLPSTPAFALVRVSPVAGSWLTAFSSAAVQADGELHTQTLDLGPLTPSFQIVGVQVHVVAGASTAARFTLERCDFTDQPPGYPFPPPPVPPPSQAGFTMDLSTAAGWVAHPEWLGSGNRATTWSLHSTGSTLVCAVTDAGKGMKWGRTGLGPLDTSAYPIVAMRYRSRHLRASAADYALYLNGAGEARPFYQADLLADGVWHWAVAPVGIPTVTWMALQVQSDAGGEAFLEIGALQFLTGDPRIDLSFYAPVQTGWDPLTSGTTGFALLDLASRFNVSADQVLPRMGLNVPWFGSEQLLADGRIPFRIRPQSPNLISTELPTLSDIRIPVGQAAGEVYFLLGAFLPARETPANDNLVAAVDETERFSVGIDYTDKTHEDFFPVDVSSGLHRISNRTFTALAVPADPARPIEAITLRDRSDGGLFALAALTLNTSGSRFYDSAFAIPAAESVVVPPNPPTRPVEVQYTSPTLRLENTFVRFEFDLSQGLALKDWTSHFTGHSLVRHAPDRRFFSGKIDGNSFTSLDCAVTGMDIHTSGTATVAVTTLALKGYESRLAIALTAWIDASAEAQFALTVTNQGPYSYSFELTVPDLPYVTLGPDPAAARYAFPRETFLLGKAPVSVTESYSGSFPVQFMDVYDPTQGWGVCLLVKDLDLIPKQYRLSKSREAAALGVRYPTLASTGLPAGGQMEVAPFALVLHPGDWHQGMAAYRQWASTWYAARSTRQKWFQEVYTCRRDYPIGGSGYLFDRPVNSYTFDAEIANAGGLLGGADMIDISSWGWSATYGRVGDYRRYELGGLDNFRSGIAAAQGQNVPVGLYIEGYSLDDRSTIWGQSAKDWVILRSTGEPYNTGGHEFFICPHVTGWQDYMQGLYTGVVTDTNASAMYIDIFGMASESMSCYSAAHGHRVGEPPLRGEFQFTRKIREGLNAVRPGTPLYTEYTPVDVTSQFQDGSFSYTIWNGNNEVSPTETNLFRFCFPDFKQFELVNGLFDAKNWTEEGLKKAFVNGEGLWIKGDLASWYDVPILAFYIKSHELFRDHRDAFATAAPEAFFPTQKGNLFAHRFPATEKQILTFYNANWRTVVGELLSLGPVADAHVVDLWGERMLDTVGTAADYTVTGSLFPRDIGCVGVFQRHIDVQHTGRVLSITRLDGGGPTQLELVGVDGPQRRVRQPVYAGPTFSVDLDLYFHPLPNTLIVKLKQDGLVLDEVILSDLSSSAFSSVSWAAY